MTNLEIAKIKKSTKRVGRGPSGGHGKTSCRGMNGQKSRTGASTTFVEGNKTKLINRLPKRKGFTSKSKDAFVITSDKINGLFKSGTEVTLAEFSEKTGISLDKLKKCSRVKIINKGNLEGDLRFSEEFRLAKSLQKVENKDSDGKNT